MSKSQESVAKSTVRDRGWTSPWIFVDGSGDDPSKPSAENMYTQKGISVEGDMALVTRGTAVAERHFPAVKSGILKIEMFVRLENPTIEINGPHDSVLKIYGGDEGAQYAFRWHYPYAWPEVGGNTYPRFYVIDGLGKKRKGLEHTDFRIEADRWYKTAAVLNFGTKTWEFWLDDVKFDYRAQFGREMAWWKKPERLSKILITSVYAGKNWIDAIRILHNDKLIAATGFNSNDGYEDGKSIIHRPAEGLGEKSQEYA